MRELIDLNELKRDPEGVLERLRLSADSSQESREVLPRIEAWFEQRQRVAALRDDKQEAAAAFRAPSMTAADREELKARMTVATNALRDAEKELRSLEAGFAERCADRDDVALPLIPERFTLEAPPGTAPDDLSFECLSAENSGEWDAFVASDPRASIYHFSRWELWIREVMRQHSMCLLARANGRAVGVLPLYRLRSRLFGHFAVSVPYVNYGGPLGLNQGVERALLDKAASEADALDLSHVEVREMHARDGWAVRSDKVSMVRALPSSSSDLERELGAKLRSQVRRGAREGFQLRFGADMKLLEGFYRVFARNMRDLGTPVYAIDAFAEVLRLWPEQATLLVAWKGAKPVGGALLMRYNDVLEIPWASTLREYNSVSLNMLLYRHALEFAIESRCRYFDFGRSTEGSGTFRFKRQWGAQPVRHYWHYWLRDNEKLPGLTPQNPRYRFLIGCWQRMPVALTRVLGPAIVRSLP